MKVLRFTFYNLLYSIQSELTILITSILCFIIWFADLPNSNVYLWWMVFLNALVTAPSLGLLILYIQENKGSLFEIYSDRIVYFKNGTKSKTYKVDEISHIRLCISPNMYKTYYQQEIRLYLGIDYFYYAEVFLPNGEKIYLTSLLSRNLVDDLKILKGVEIKPVLRRFNTIQ